MVMMHFKFLTGVNEVLVLSNIKSLNDKYCNFTFQI